MGASLATGHHKGDTVAEATEEVNKVDMDHLAGVSCGA
jgi:hypothetical protein